MQQVICLCVDDDDARADCFVFACEQLADRGFRRLRKFDPSGTASFATWLRAVVRNLCIDWQRKNHGRYQAFEWTKGLDSLDRQVFHCVYEQGYTADHTFERLVLNFPGLTLRMVEQSVLRLGEKLTQRERWLLSSREVQVDSLDAAEDQRRSAFSIPDAAPDPEHAAMESEYQESLSSAMQGLPAGDQVLLRLRFEQDLTLAEIARLSGLKDAQAADRRLRSLLDQLRGRLSGFSPRLREKTKAASV